MRLTADLIEKSAAFTNPLGNRELDLRSNSIPLIENLIITKDLFDTIDLSDNEIKKIENFPRLNRLSTLFLARNSISRVDASLFSPSLLPSLHTLVLSHNRILDFGDFEPLSAFASQLRHLSLLDNPVCKRPNYRQFVLSRLPKLRTLDFKQVKTVEVEEARRIFPASSATSNVFELPKDNDGEEEDDEITATTTAESARKRGKLSLSQSQADRIRKAIAAAQTLADVSRLEKFLQSGHIPDDLDLNELLKGSENDAK